MLVITNAGGAGTLISDLICDRLNPPRAEQIEKLSEVLPRHWSKKNPIDIIGDATHERYQKVLEIADGFNADAIYVLVTPQFMTDTEAISKIFVGQTFHTRVFPVLLGGVKMEAACRLLRHAGIIFFEELTEAVSFL